MPFKLRYIWLLGILCFWAIGPSASFSETGKGALAQEETMLMFVGEDLEILSIASRREESAWEAPAVAQVITRQQIREQGIKTVSQALERVPGFFMAQKEWGTRPYLRGIPESILFLYDTVPLSFDITKSLHPLDNELSLAPVKRIEIVRGPGSVLWGPDAFAGIVNVVPMTGRDFQGVETGILYGTPGDQAAFYVNAGGESGHWDAFASISGRSGVEDDTPVNLVSFWGDGQTVTPPEDRFGLTEPGRSRYFEMSGRVAYQDWLSISGRLSDNYKPYAVTNDRGDLTWRESRSAPLGFVKVESKKELDRNSALRLTGSYTWISPEFEVLDRTLEQKERTAYGELLYDRSFLAGRGLFTGGVSYREKRVRNAPIWVSYLPDFLGPENPSFFPILVEQDYDTSLWSAFGQYSHKIGTVDLLLGLRYDMHDEYQDALSFSSAVKWAPSDRWILKLLFGTAYRTPFARQLRDDLEPNLEKIRSLSAQVSWKPSRQLAFSLVGFHNHLDNHVVEDPFAGLSEPNTQDVNGIELEGTWSLSKNLEFSSNLTLLDNSGPDEALIRATAFEPDEDGNFVPVEFETLNYPYDVGPRTQFNLMATWRPVERISLFGRLGYFSSRELLFPRSKEFRSFPGVWLVDLNARVKDFLFPKLDLDISFKNLFDRRYETPGTYNAINGDGFRAEFSLSKKW